MPGPALVDGDLSWERMAEPQADQYDSFTSLELAERRGAYHPPGPGNASTFLEGRVALYDRPTPFPPYCIPAPRDHPTLAKTCEVLRFWPAGFSQCQLLIQAVSIFIDTRNPSDQIVGSRSAAGEGFGRIAATINNHVGFGEAIVREMAHQKLAALGVGRNSSCRLIKNPREQRFPYPGHKIRSASMPSILRLLYSSTYVAALDLAILQGSEDLERNRLIATASLPLHLAKVGFCLEVVRSSAEVDNAGADFLEGLFAWSTRLLTTGTGILEDFDVSPKIFASLSDLRTVAGSFSPGSTAEPQDIRPCRIEGLREYGTLDEMVLYEPRSQKAFSFNRSAKAIWELCDGQRTLLEISRELGRRFDLPGADLLTVTRETVAQLGHLNLLQLRKETC